MDEPKGARPPRPGPSLKARALKYLAMREHSRMELARKLGPHAESPEALAAVLDRLEETGLLSDARFAEALAHRMAARHGVAGIQAELQRRGVADVAREPALADLRTTEAERAWACWVRRYGEVMPPDVDVAERQRRWRYLLARGFSASTVQEIFKRASE